MARKGTDLEQSVVVSTIYHHIGSCGRGLALLAGVGKGDR